MKARTFLSIVLKFQAVVIPIFSTNNGLYSQNSIRCEQFMGEWRVVKWQPLFHYKSDSIIGESDFDKDSLQCVKSIVNITDSGLYIKPAYKCDFDEYSGKFSIRKVVDLLVVPESEESKQHPGLEIDNGKISKTLCRILHFRGLSLRMVVTDYNIDWGDGSKLRIFILKNNLIALFRGGDIILLNRLEK